MDIDAAIQEYVQSLRAGRVVNKLVVMAAAEGIVAAKDVSKLMSHGGHIEITKTWARSAYFIQRTGLTDWTCGLDSETGLADWIHVDVRTRG